jgi:hypothetical protein
MSTTFNFNKPVIGLDGHPLVDVNGPITMGGVLAPVIASQSKGDALKLFGWASAIYKKEDLILDKSDQNTLKDFINASEQMTVLVKAQLLEVLN